MDAGDVQIALTASRKTSTGIFQLEKQYEWLVATKSAMTTDAEVRVILDSLTAADYQQQFKMKWSLQH